MLAALRASFAFLTILISGRIFSNSCIKKSTFFYPIVGIVLGIILSYSSFLFLQLTDSPPLATVIYLILSFILTRGLHHDGLADVGDAWGSCARGAKFRTILKDSRIGSFGTIILILYFLLCYTAISHILSIQLTHDLVKYSSQNTFPSVLTIFPSLPSIFPSLLDIFPNLLALYSNVIFILFLAPIWGRVGLLLQPAFDMPYISDTAKKENSHSDTTLPTSLSQNMVHPFQKSRFFIWLFISIIMFLFFIPPTRLIFILGLSSLVFLGFYLLSKRENGYNGDFLGAQCLCFEAVVFLSIYA